MFLASASLDFLVSHLREVAEFVQAEGFKVIQTYRHPKLQEVYFAQGRYTLRAVNKKREELGLPPIREFENVIITKTQRSRHSICLAFDVLYAGENTKANRHFLSYYVETARKVKARYHWVSCGALWSTFKDYGHYELSLPEWSHYRFRLEHRQELDKFYRLSEQVQTEEDAKRLLAQVQDFVDFLGVP